MIEKESKNIQELNETMYYQKAEIVKLTKVYEEKSKEAIDTKT
jgi:hypothetical protein